MNDASSEQRKRTAPATSSGVPSRAIGVFARIACCSSSGSRPSAPSGCIRRDRVRPHTARGQLFASDFVNPMIPASTPRKFVWPGFAVDPDDARQVDDRPGPLLHHPARRRPAGVEGSAEVRVEDCLPVLVGHPQSAGRRARQPALLTRMSRSPACSTSPAACAGSATSACTRAADLLGQRSRLLGSAPVADHDLRPGARELHRDRAPRSRARRRVTSASFPSSEAKTGT